MGAISYADQYLCEDIKFKDVNSMHRVARGNFHWLTCGLVISFLEKVFYVFLNAKCLLISACIQYFKSCNCVLEILKLSKFDS